DSITNQDVEQRQWLALFQIMTNYYRQVLELSQVLGDVNLFANIGTRAIQASDELVRRLFETYQIPDTDRFTLGTKNEAHEGNLLPSPSSNGGAPVGAIGSTPAGAVRRFNLPPGVGGT